MRLTTLLDCMKGCTDYNLMHNPEIQGIKMDSRKITDGDLFVAISGFESDGHHFIQEAIDNGAAAVIGEQQLQLSVPYVQVKDSRFALGKIASAFYGYPSRNHIVVGVTGTNGKTTVSYILKHILETAGRTCSLLGTVSYIINKEQYLPTNTTPDALQLQELVARSNDEFVVLEVSSHALKQSRVVGLELDFGLFTNLSHDHLDYHDNMDDYFHVKCEMFSYLKKGGKGIVSLVNPWGEKLAAKLNEQSITHLTMGYGDECDLQIENIRLDGVTEFTLKSKEVEYGITFPCPGLHNVYNAGLAFLAALELGIEPEFIVKGLETFPGVPGRFEMVAHPSGATFIVDYAHTQDAIEYCLQAAKEHNARRITHIYGFRGARDESKREHMVKVSASMSDDFVLTFDDLNGVPEEEMLSELHELNRLFGGEKGFVIPDRTLAIQNAWENAREGDWVLITGKGPEKYNEKFHLPVSTDMEALLYLKKMIAKEQVI
ncbi:UDP-N-acetylmuramoyl-L-alanyl-D-glutamate--2,6-diaminopimelate ligase [Bacillus sp. T33-2]|uniref:UDP-N-acetylmuramoyl-L-alanyl-D-glutamate--2, 6-diaminopimelate ligase n=1 Tax=Bacillus sp. T33-2 TaxID=2054168 RepID=UPI000C76B4B6|nr:UDP-N-acetylmuramoyl-L-alanyl-D-glutamate--2,6-diaminopimelate ligase [Bacillus sp. T33-2]PLR97536.1 UDP-N-acetylmuramoyl-L-alanyl-D-glutamate--2,6-diaminopimelate ligase [Bacillus sp. T33-2]